MNYSDQDTAARAMAGAAEINRSRMNGDGGNRQAGDQAAPVALVSANIDFLTQIKRGGRP